MLRQHSKKSKPKRGPTKYGSIVTDAKTLGVNRTHLWRVLIGQRESQPLMRRYRELKAQKAHAE